MVPITTVRYGYAHCEAVSALLCAPLNLALLYSPKTTKACTESWEAALTPDHNHVYLC